MIIHLHGSMDHFLDGLLVILCCLGVDVLLWNNLLSASGGSALFCFLGYYLFHTVQCLVIEIFNIHFIWTGDVFICIYT